MDETADQGKHAEIVDIAGRLRTWAQDKPTPVKWRAKSIADDLVLLTDNPTLAGAKFNQMLAAKVADLDTCASRR